MELSEARKVVVEGSGDWPRLVEAAGTICDMPDCSFDDLLACLKYRGLPSEFAAMRLYLRTKRPRANDSIESFVMDWQDWSDYLRRHGFLQARSAVPNFSVTLWQWA